MAISGFSAAQLARPMFDYWLLTRKKNQIRPATHQISGGLMTAGIKPGELPSGINPVTADANATNQPQSAQPATQTVPSTAPSTSSQPVESE